MDPTRVRIYPNVGNPSQLSKASIIPEVRVISPQGNWINSELISIAKERRERERVRFDFFVPSFQQ